MNDFEYRTFHSTFYFTKSREEIDVISNWVLEVFGLNFNRFFHFYNPHSWHNLHLLGERDATKNKWNRLCKKAPADIVLDYEKDRARLFWEHVQKIVCILTVKNPKWSWSDVEKYFATKKFIDTEVNVLIDEGPVSFKGIPSYKKRKRVNYETRPQSAIVGFKCTVVGCRATVSRERDLKKHMKSKKCKAIQAENASQLNK